MENDKAELPRRQALFDARAGSREYWLRASQRIPKTEPQIGDRFDEVRAARRHGPDRRAIGQAGDPAEGPRGRARPPVRGIQGPRRHDHQRCRQARGIRQRHRRYRPGRGVLRRNDKIGRESYRNGDRIRCYIKDVRRETRGPQIFLSRTAPEFMAELFKMEVPEIYDGIIEIKAVARDPGSRAKIAVISYDNSIDPVGACVGMRGSRVQAVVNELQGEKIDIIPWNEDAPTFLVNALQPAEVSKVVLDEDAERSRSWCPTSSCRSPSAGAARTCAWPRS
jgi:transcription antitermination factor NusA-like protein